MSGKYEKHKRREEIAKFILASVANNYLFSMDKDKAVNHALEYADILIEKIDKAIAAEPPDPLRRVPPAGGPPTYHSK